MVKAVSLLTGSDLGVMVCEALQMDASNVQRIIIDISSRGPVRIYVEMIASNKILDVGWTAGLTGAEVKILEYCGFESHKP